MSAKSILPGTLSQPGWSTRSTFVRLFPFRRRTVRITAHGWRFVSLTVVVGLAAVNTGNNLLYLLLGMMLSLLTVSGILSDRMLRRLTAHRQVPETIFANQPVTIALTLTSHHPWLPCFSLQLRDRTDDGDDQLEDRADVPLNAGHAKVAYLPPKVAVTRTYRLRLRRRGWHRLRGVELTTRFPFGFFTKSMFLPVEQTTLVYPETKPLSMNLAALVRSLGHESSQNRRGEGQQLYQLRAYQPQEDARKIHWKVSARQGRLILQETQTDPRAHLTMILPTDPPMEAMRAGKVSAAFEQAVIRAASVTSALVEAGCRFRAIIGETRGPYGSGLNHLHSIMRTLAVCQPKSDLNGEAEGDLLQAFHHVTEDAVIVILPWESPSLGPRGLDGCTVIRAWEDP